MRTLIYGGRIVNEGRCFEGSIVIDDERIEDITEEKLSPLGNFQQTIDATGCFVLPGIIDDHVHFREPGMTAKADIGSESRAAAFGGVTSCLEMPNTNPQTTTLEVLHQKWDLARQKSHVNYGFFFGATNTNADLFSQLDLSTVPGVKLFMGSSTGNMLVDREEALERVFATAARLRLPVMAHCEDTAIINRNMKGAKAAFGPDPAIEVHSLIRSEEACWQSSAKAASLARRYGTRLHIAHLSTKRELSLLGDNVTGEAVLAHLIFDNSDYARLGALIKCNPAVKTPEDKAALREALRDRISVVGTDHAPHLLEEKQGGAATAKSGMPMVQFSLVAMLGLVDEGVLSLERLVQLMAHNPATLFGIVRRGFLRRGYQADIAVVRPGAGWTLTRDMVQSKCGWSPLEGRTFRWQVVQTLCNGRLVYDRRNGGLCDGNNRGQQLTFNR